MNAGFHDRPVEAPEQDQESEQDEIFAGQLMHGAAQ
jgi:hypothetical protein